MQHKASYGVSHTIRWNKQYESWRLEWNTACFSYRIICQLSPLLCCFSLFGHISDTRLIAAENHRLGLSRIILYVCVQYVCDIGEGWGEVRFRSEEFPLRGGNLLPGTILCLLFFPPLPSRFLSLTLHRYLPKHIFLSAEGEKTFDPLLK